MSISKLTQNDKFRSWLNKINELIDSVNQSITDLNGKAAKKHSSTETSYGLGTSIEYGHLKLSDSINNTSNVNNGIAATPYSVKLAYDLASEAKELAQNTNTSSGTININSIIITNNTTITEDNILNVILVNGNYIITIPNIKVNAVFTIKNISGSDVTIHPNGITIDGSSEDIILRQYEFIQIIQYSDTEYAIIIDNRVKSYDIMDLNLENTIMTTDTVTTE